MVTEGGGVVTHAGHHLQLAADLAAGGRKGRPHAEIACIKYQYRTLILSRRPPPGDQGGQTSVPTSGRVVIQCEWRVVGGWSHSDKG
jgi:hypothetical protein